jgi:serine/threonine-protein kinase
MNARGITKIGMGVSATVYKGLYKGRIVAVKELHHHLAMSEELCGQLVREIETNMSFKHPNICRVYGGWPTHNKEHGIYPSMVMDYVPLTLRAVLADPVKYSLTPLAKKSIIYQLASCLMNLHTRHPPVYHCDLKPENIMLTEDLTVKLIDFGIAKIERMTLVSEISGQSACGVRGTMGYMV